MNIEKFLRRCGTKRLRYLILDRDTEYSDEFRNALVREGIHVIRLPPRRDELAESRGVS
jgi:hypothetical protein